MIFWFKIFIDKLKVRRSQIKRMKDLKVNVKIIHIDLLSHKNKFIVYFSYDKIMRSEFTQEWPPEYYSMDYSQRHDYIKSTIAHYFDNFYKHTEGLQETKMFVTYQKRALSDLESLKREL